jgi:hypothetical protein
MNDIILHIGYQKTASSTLQEAVFCELDKKECIDYHGRAIQYDNQFYGDFILSNNDISEIQFSEDTVNLISEEPLTEPEFYKKKRIDKRFPDHTGDRPTDPYEFPSRIESLLSNGQNNVEVLVTIRNQVDLIFSMYVHLYNWLDEEEDEILLKWSNFYKNLMQQDELNQAFFFAEWLDEYRYRFGDGSIHILLFEDLKHKKEAFVSTLCEVLDVEEREVISNGLEQKHNVSSKSSKGYIHEEKSGETKIGQFFEKGMGKPIKQGSELVLHNAVGEESRVTKKLREFYFSLRDKKEAKTIAYPTETEKKELTEFFREDCEKLAENYGVSQQKLSEYKYL